MKRKKIIRVRESLPGFYAIEEIDMTNDVGTARVNFPVGKGGKTAWMSEVSVLDLTSAD
jgi:hypothetical protein